MEDLVSTGRQLFRFSADANLVFGTSALDVCRGGWIEIEESAYRPLLEFLDEVTVGIRVAAFDDAAGGRQGKAHGPGPIDDFSYAKGVAINAQKSAAREEPKPDASTSINEGSTIVYPVLPSRDLFKDPPEPPATIPSPWPPKSTLQPEPEPTVSIPSKSKFRPKPLEAEPAPKSTKSRLQRKVPDPELEEEFEEDLVSAPAPAPKSKPTPKPRQRKLEPEPESEPVPVAKPTSTRRQRQPEPDTELGPEPQSDLTPKPRQRKVDWEPEPEAAPKPESSKALRRQRVKPDPEPAVKFVEEEEEAEAEPARESPDVPASTSIAGSSQTPEPEDEEEFWRFGNGNKGLVATAESSKASTRGGREPGTFASGSGGGSQVFVKVKVEGEEAKGKARADRARLSIIGAARLPLASERPGLVREPVSSQDERFMVPVFGPKAGEAAEFKTRGGHKVRKVLETVCKTFKYPYDKSRLLLPVEKDGKKTYYVCETEETVWECGLTTETRVMLQVEGVVPDENAGEEEEEEEEGAETEED
ncbi:hypothetical protein DXG01_006105 [Tephrocybe rancida]|nr:hypothetical protein DXG01_006105 [Tephrocybe rancida]